VHLHISSEESNGVRTVHVSGRLSNGGAEELKRVCGKTGRLRLDVSQLVSADEEATRLLADLQHGGAQLVGTPPYIHLLLEARRKNT
jgi:hypothetical protein